MFLQINEMQKVVTQQIAENQYSDIKKVSKLQHLSFSISVILMFPELVNQFISHTAILDACYCLLTLPCQGPGLQVQMSLRIKPHH